MLCHFSLLLLLGRNELPFIQLNTSAEIATMAVGHFDDGTSHAINIPNGFPFDGTTHTTLYVSAVPRDRILYTEDLLGVGGVNFISPLFQLYTPYYGIEG